MALIMLSRGIGMVIVAQVIAGAAAAAVVPTLVVLVADNYKGEQQQKALGWLAGAMPAGIVLAFLIAGALATMAGWRYTFGLLVLLSAVVWILSAKLNPVRGRSGVRIDAVGVVLSAAAVLFISMGANNLTHWGVLLAGPRRRSASWTCRRRRS